MTKMRLFLVSLETIIIMWTSSYHLWTKNMNYNTIYYQIYLGIYCISHSGLNIMHTAGEKYAV